MKVICDVLRSPREEGLYLYVKREEGLKHVPDALLNRFGKPQPAMTLVLTPERKLARTTAERVLACLEDPGYYLQLPPRPETEAEGEAAQIRGRNSLMGS